MANTKDNYIRNIGKYDGYVGKPIFQLPDATVYYDYALDVQCRIPIASTDELKKELGML